MADDRYQAHSPIDHLDFTPEIGCVDRGRFCQYASHAAKYTVEIDCGCVVPLCREATLARYRASQSQTEQLCPKCQKRLIHPIEKVVRL